MMAVTHQEQSQRGPEKRQSQRTPVKPAEGEQPQGGRIARVGRKILGPLLVFLLLAGYFVWLGTEMGGATPNGQTEMAAVFGAILVAVLALAGGAWAGRHFQ